MTQRDIYGMSVLAATWLLASGALAQTTATQPDITPPSIAYGPLYSDVELARIFPDSKTFPDLVPNSDPADIAAAYKAAKASDGFDLSGFVSQHFTGPTPAGPTIGPASAGQGLLDYVSSLWPQLAQTDTSVPQYSSLQPLPYPYVVPGGRFREVYYWDSYFTMLGLEQDGQHALAQGMLKNFAYELDTYGLIPNGNRSYYLSRSQPPFFSLMVELIAATDGNDTLRTYLPELQREWNFWMAGASGLPPGSAQLNAVRLADGTLLNRYWDARDVPRDESYFEDSQTAQFSARPPKQVYRSLRAAAESGWDFSSRWLRDGRTLATIRTTNIVPVDLNCLLAHLEQTLSEAYLLAGDAAQSAKYQQYATQRSDAIRRLLWDSRNGVFGDLLWQTGRLTGDLSAATLYPLFLHVADPNQAAQVAAAVRNRLLDVGGLDTSLVTSGQQWDAPNGWAPLQWIAVQGLRDYGFADLAGTIASRWVAKNIAGYQQSAKLVEKYNVTTSAGDAGSGGEYATQIGFGWTNGVLVALTAQYPDLKAAAQAAVPNAGVSAAQ